MIPKNKPFWRNRLFWNEVLLFAAMFAAVFGAMAVGRYLW